MERRPSFVRTSSPRTSVSPASVTTVTRSTRCDAFTVVRTSSIVPFTPSFFASAGPVNATGPQLWCGEALSYGSATETRYGTGSPDHVSAALAVRPPLVEKKNVWATLPLVEQHLARRLADRGGRRRLLGADAAVDLAAHVRVEVEGAGAARRERVRACDHGLRLQRLDGPVRRDLVRDDAREIGLEPDDVDDAELPGHDGDLELAAVGPAVEEQRLRAGCEQQRPGQSAPRPARTRSPGPNA